MNKSKILKILLVVVFFYAGCKQEESIQQQQVQFSVTGSSVLSSTRTKSNDLQPSKLVVSVENSNGTVLSREEFDLYQFGDNYLSFPVTLKVGAYTLTEFLVLNESNEVIYVTPVEGSDLAHLVEDPLSINFMVSENDITTVSPQVVEVTEDAASYGYGQFGFDIVDKIDIVASVFIKTETNFELTDANIQIEAGDWFFEKALQPQANRISLRSAEEYTITVNKPGYQIWQQTMTLADEQPIEILLEEMVITGYDVAWSRIFAGSLSDKGSRSIATTDGGYLMVGHSSSSDGDFAGYHSSGSDYLMVKVDAQGQTEWMKKFGNGHVEGIKSVVESKNKDGYLLIGYAYMPWSQIWYAKVDLQGEVVWSKTIYGGSSTNWGTRVVESTNGYVIAGSTVEQSRLHLCEINEAGDVLWQETYLNTAREVHTLLPLTSGGFVLTGSGDRNGVYTKAFMRIDNNGSVVWSKNIQTLPGDFHPINVIELDNQLFVSGGTTVYKTDLEGNILEKKDFEDYISIPAQLPDGNLVFRSGSDIGTMNKDLEIVFSEPFDNTEYYPVFGDILSLNNGELLITGFTYKTDPDKGDAVIVKLVPR